MKKIIISLLVLSSIPAYANEYVKDTIHCKIRGDEQSLASVENKTFSESINVIVSGTRLQNKRKYLIIEQDADSKKLIQLESLRKVVDIKDTLIGEPNGSLKIKFKDLNSSSSKELLEALGAQDVPNLPTGFKMKTISPEVYGKYSTRSQVHFTAEENYGLSYHLNIRCCVKGINYVCDEFNF